MAGRRVEELEALIKSSDSHVKSNAWMVNMAMALHDYDDEHVIEIIRGAVTILATRLAGTAESLSDEVIKHLVLRVLDLIRESVYYGN